MTVNYALRFIATMEDRKARTSFRYVMITETRGLIAYNVGKIELRIQEQDETL